jgi:hypothetical protein
MKENFVTNDQGERVMLMEGMDTLTQCKLLFPKTIATIKKVIFGERNVKKAVETLEGNKSLTKEQKGAVLFLASGSRLTRPFN